MAKVDNDVIDGQHIFWSNSAIPQGLLLHMYTNPRLRKLIVNWTIQSFNVTKALNQLLPKSVYPLANTSSGWTTTRGLQNDSVVSLDQHRIWSSLYRPFRVSVPLQARLSDSKDNFSHSRVYLPRFTEPSFLSFERSKSYSSIPTDISKETQTLNPLPGGKSPQWKLPRSMSMLSLRSPSLYSISPIHWLGSGSRDNIYKSTSSSKNNLKGISSNNHCDSDRFVPRFGRGSLEYAKANSRYRVFKHKEQERFSDRSTISTEDDRNHSNYTKYQRTIDSASILHGRKMVSTRRMQDESFMRVSHAFDKPNLLCNSENFSSFNLEDASNQILKSLPPDRCNSRYIIPDVPNFHYAMYNDVTYVRLILSYSTSKGSGWNTVCDPVRNKFDMMNAVQIDMAAVTIQNAVRAYCARKKRLIVSQLVSFFFDANEAATKIQAQWRTFKARNELQKRKYLRRILKARSKAATTIQRAYREMREKELQLIKSAVETQLMTRHLCAIVLQKNWRGNRARQRLEADMKLFSLRWPYDGPNHVVEVVGTFTVPAWKIRTLLSWDNADGCYVLHMTRNPGTFEIQFIIDGHIVIHGGLPIVDDIHDLQYKYNNQMTWYKKKKSTGGQTFPGVGMRNLLTIESEDKRYEAVLSFRRFLQKHTRNTIYHLLKQENLLGSHPQTEIDQKLGVIPPYTECNIDSTLTAVEEHASNWWSKSMSVTKIAENDYKEIDQSKWYSDLMKSAAATWITIKIGENQYMNYANRHNGNVVIALYAIFLIGSREKLSEDKKIIYNESILNKIFQLNRRPTLLSDSVWEDPWIPKSRPIFVSKSLTNDSSSNSKNESITSSPDSTPDSRGWTTSDTSQETDILYEEDHNRTDVMSVLDEDSRTIEDRLLKTSYDINGLGSGIEDNMGKDTPRPFMREQCVTLTIQHNKINDKDLFKVSSDESSEEDIYYSTSSSIENDIDSVTNVTTKGDNNEINARTTTTTPTTIIRPPHKSIIDIFDNNNNNQRLQEDESRRIRK